MFEVLLSLIFLVALGVSGFVALARARLGLTQLELVAFGFPVGMVFWSLVTLGIACILGQMSLALVLGIGIASLIVAIVLYVSGTSGDGPWPGGIGLRQQFLPSNASVGFVPGPVAAWDDDAETGTLSLAEGIRRALAWRWFWPVIVCGGLILRWVFLWGGMFEFRPNEGLFTGQINVWGDWPQHVGDAASFVYGNNFPPEHPRMAGVPYAYHYLSSLTGAMFIHFGLTPYVALALHSFVLSAFIAIGVLAFALRLLRDARAAALAVLLFILGGGFGWVLIAQLANDNGDILGTIWNQPWDIGPQKANRFWWENFYLSNIEPQRSVLYGLPLSLLILTLLLIAVQRWRLRLFVAAGLVFGLMPFSHLGALPALAVVIPMVALLFPTGHLRGPLRQWYPARKWLAFGVIAAGLAIPQLILQQIGQPAVTGGVSFHFGWLKADFEPAWWFWLKNLGWFAPLILIGLFMPRLFGSVAYRFLLAFMPIFIVCNVLTLQIDPLDNIKTLLYWHLAVCVLTAAVIAHAWRMDRSPAARVIVLSVVVTMFFSGLLVNLQQARGLNSYRWESIADMEIAELVRQQTAPHTVFVIAPRPDHPVSTLTGRPVLMSYYWWLTTRGFDVEPRQEALRDIYALSPSTDQLIAEYEIDYVVIGPTERNDYEPDLDDWRERFPVAIETDEYEVFAVSDDAERRLERDRERARQEQAGTSLTSPSESASPATSPSSDIIGVSPSRQPATAAGTPMTGTTPVASGTPAVAATPIGTPLAVPMAATPVDGTPVSGTPPATPLAPLEVVAASTPTPGATRPPRRP